MTAAKLTASGNLVAPAPNPMEPDELETLEAMIAAEFSLDAAIPAAEHSSPSDSANRFWFDLGLVLGLAAVLA